MTARKAAADLLPRGPKRKPRPPPNPNGRPPHEPTEANRQLVKTLVVAGWNRDRIGVALDIDAETLRKYYRVELDHSKAIVDAMVTQSIIQMACGGPGAGNWEKAVPSMASFYAKCRMNWKDPKLEVNLSGAVGTYDMSKMSDDDLRRVTEILSRAEISAPNGVSSGDQET